VSATFALGKLYGVWGIAWAILGANTFYGLSILWINHRLWRALKS
jgi:hypothetical protein